MNRSRLLTLGAAVAALALLPAPALAQRGGARGGHASASRGSVHLSAPRAVSGARGGVVSRSYSAPMARYSAGRVYGSGTAIRASRGFAPQSRGGHGGYGHVVVGHGGVYRGGGHAVYVAPAHYYRPYYTFHPHFSIGFGLWVGYPFAYSSFYYGYPYGYPYYSPYYYPPYPAYGYPYPTYPYGAYAPPPGYGYGNGYPYASSQPQYPNGGYAAPSPSQYPNGNYQAPPPSVVAEQGGESGGITFDITPSTAEVYVDSSFMGRVSDLGPTTQPMGLKPGRHHVEIRASGYQTASIDVDIIAGQVIPYRGQLERIQ